jgi:hypothetical protein
MPTGDASSGLEADRDGTGATSTFPGSGPSVGWDRFERSLRFVAVVVVFGVVGFALLGFAGLTTATARNGGGRLRVEVSYAEVSRPGLATPLVIDIRSTDGPLPSELTVELPRDYLAMFDENGLDPPPDSITSDGDTEIWTFFPGDVSALSIDFDARLQPNMHYDRDGWVIVTGGDDEVRVDFTTRVMP